MKKPLTIALLLCFLLCSCTSKPKLTKYSNTSAEGCFDTYVSLIAYTESEEEFNHYFDIVKENFMTYHQLFDIYHEYEGINNLKTINDQAGIAPVKVDQKIIDMLNFVIKATSINDSFDITSGNLLSLWHHYRDSVIDPDDEAIQKALPLRGLEYLEIDDENDTVYISDPDISLDVGGIAKGYTAQVVSEILKAEGLEHGALDAGGNIKTIGTKDTGDLWVSAIRNPGLIASGIVSFVTPLDATVVTSGNYINFYYAPNGNKYHHIIDLSTGYPADYYESVTIITDDSGLADFLSTTIFTLPYEKAMEVKQAFEKAYDTTISIIFITRADHPLNCPNLIEAEGYNIYYTDDIAGAINK
ncbi:MAG: FAD:protein FMN transferase [Erysipelotrichaceae bacterium]|jgi:thiamine biosynthesis lipoprotein|nr:FAD:protein FMN transferase [Erysipelotrichaceae bacterium]